MIKICNRNFFFFFDQKLWFFFSFLPFLIKTKVLIIVFKNNCFQFPFEVRFCSSKIEDFSKCETIFSSLDWFNWAQIYLQFLDFGFMFSRNSISIRLLDNICHLFHTVCLHRRHIVCLLSNGKFQEAFSYNSMSYHQIYHVIDPRQVLYHLEYDNTYCVIFNLWIQN